MISEVQKWYRCYKNGYSNTNMAHKQYKWYNNDINGTNNGVWSEKDKNVTK